MELTPSEFIFRDLRKVEFKSTRTSPDTDISHTVSEVVLDGRLSGVGLSVTSFRKINTSITDTIFFFFLRVSFRLTFFVKRTFVLLDVFVIHTLKLPTFFWKFFVVVDF